MPLPFIAIIILFFSIPVINIGLFVWYLINRRKLNNKEQVIVLVLFLLVVIMYLSIFIAPMKDGGVFVQALIAGIIGLFITIYQVAIISSNSKEYEE